VEKFSEFLCSVRNYVEIETENLLAESQSFFQSAWDGGSNNFIIFCVDRSRKKDLGPHFQRRCSQYIHLYSLGQ